MNMRVNEEREEEYTDFHVPLPVYLFGWMRVVVVHLMYFLVDMSARHHFNYQT